MTAPTRGRRGAIGDVEPPAEPQRRPPDEHSNHSFQEEIVLVDALRSCAIGIIATAVGVRLLPRGLRVVVALALPPGGGKDLHPLGHRAAHLLPALYHVGGVVPGVEGDVLLLGRVVADVVQVGAQAVQLGAEGLGLGAVRVQAGELALRLAHAPLAFSPLEELDLVVLGGPEGLKALLLSAAELCIELRQALFLGLPRRLRQTVSL
mmetsp:Transcript_19260/g.64550  ORF Transcript_19260/g.64550 Transcript_19260/m.64550 type:complete len:207 (-) Transcript_19260:115-735(-)